MHIPFRKTINRKKFLINYTKNLFFIKPKYKRKINNYCLNILEKKIQDLISIKYINLNIYKRHKVS